MLYGAEKLELGMGPWECVVQAQCAELTCSDSDADVVFLIDTTSSNSTAFLVQQHRLLRTIKRLSTVLKGRSIRYGVIGFHRTPELMLELESPFANDSQRIDLTLVLDTSGSVFRVFEDQREIALNILDEIPVEAYSDAVQVSVTRFAAGADVILPFLRGRALSEIKDAVKEVKFTGQNTRIASAVEIALDEMERAKRPDAKQIFVLISDGHGQEYWNVVQATGKRLQVLRSVSYTAA
ncbi:von Willebrand factor type A domain protein [Teladorsagia circumcincta]|uniref:von Willebrand factor type A domain protein n=1 Tax=Teladorsagia circumcincta TaxID=45464 RepID=A0A2G9U266_TELCI|nr:von Willebrand factor type A domain protein [Teladorsagia circumcincta]